MPGKSLDDSLECTECGRPFRKRLPEQNVGCRASCCVEAADVALCESCWPLHQAQSYLDSQGFPHGSLGAEHRRALHAMVAYRRL